MTRALCLGLILVLGLGACVPTQRQQIKTLADLEAEKIIIDPGEHLAGDRRQALQRYRDFLTTRPGAPLESEARRRLADLELELALEGTPHEAADALQPAASDHPGDPAAAIRIYEDLLATYPGQSGNDHILYQLARAYDESGDSTAALATLDRLIRDYPDSTYAAEAHFRRGEARFLRGDYAGAAEAYGAVLALGPTVPFAEQARYKYGWALFKQERHADALDAFMAILDTKLNQTAQEPALSRAEQELVKDTLRVTSLSFSYLGGSEAIDRYLDGHPDTRYAARLYAGLGRLYLDKERFHDAAQSFAAFTLREPYHARAPDFLIQAIEAYRRGGFPSRVLAAKTDFARRYALDRPFWRRHDPAVLPGPVTYLRNTLAELARHHHARAQRSKAAADYEQAIHWYRRYLDNFPNADDTPAMHYLLAEALFESGRYRAAAQAYERVAYDYPPHPQAARAAHAALAAHDKALAGRQGAERHLWQRRALASALRLADRYPRHPQAGAALARAAQAYFSLGEIEPATVAARRLLALPGPVPSAPRLSAWLVLGHSAFDRQDFPGAETAYRRALTLIPAADEKRAAIVDRLGASIYKQGETLRAKGDLAAAAEQFLRVAAAAPRSTLRATAEYDAAAILITLRQWPRAIAVLENFRRDHPDHPLQAEIPVKLAMAYQENGRPLAAARELERIGKDEQREATLRRAALWQAAELYTDAGKLSRAAAVYKRYLQTFPAPFDTAQEARWRLAGLNRQADNTRRYHYWLRQLIEAETRAGAAARSDRSRFLAAQAALILARPALEAFRAVRLTLPLEKTLKVKKARMEQALAAYQQAADYGIAEVTTAATFRIAELYHDFGRALLASQRPTDLDEEALEQYEILLEEQAYPFEEEAIALHEVNSRRAAEGIYDDWVRASFRELAALLPVRYAKTERRERLVETIH